MDTYTAYVYKWVHLPSGKWYIGSRTCKTAHPDDGYICSSKIVKPLIMENPTEWKRIVMAVGGSKQMLELEVSLLQLFDAKNDQNSFNQTNGHLHYSQTGRTPWNKGIQMDDEYKKKISKGKTGKPSKKKGISSGPQTEEHKQKVAAALKGKKKPPRTEAHSKAISVAKTGKKQTPEEINKRREAMLNSDKVKEAVQKQCRQCTVDGITIFNSVKELIQALGNGKSGKSSPNFRYITKKDLSCH